MPKWPRLYIWYLQCSAPTESPCVWTISFYHHRMFAHNYYFISANMHNIHIHNNVLWDWRQSTECSPHSIIFRGILPASQSTVMDLNNVIWCGANISIKNNMNLDISKTNEVSANSKIVSPISIPLDTIKRYKVYHSNHQGEPHVHNISLSLSLSRSLARSRDRPPTKKFVSVHRRIGH